MRTLAAFAVLGTLLTGCDRDHRAAQPGGKPFSVGAVAWSRDDGAVAWTQSRGTRAGIWAARADGSRVRRVAAGLDSLGQISWLPDGNLLAWVDFDLVLVRPTGAERTLFRLVGGGFTLDRRGRSVLDGGVACPLCAGGIRVRSLPDGTGRALTSGAVQDLDPALSPDGEVVAFSRGRCDPRCERPDGIWVADLRTHAKRRVVAGRAGCPEWSPDGQYLAYARWEPSEIRVVGVRDGRTLATARGGGCPRFSADGRLIAFETSAGLVVRDLRSGATQVLGRLRQPLDYAWAHRSSRLLVSARPDARSCASLWLVDAAKHGTERVLRRC
jgi:hypothetical protein